MIITYIILGIVVLVVLWMIGVYNGLVKLKNRVKEGWSDIDVQLKRRHDLIPNLVSSVKGYMKHERELLENITKARSQAMSAQEAGNTADLAKAESMLGGMLLGLEGLCLLLIINILMLILLIFQYCLLLIVPLVL